MQRDPLQFTNESALTRSYQPHSAGVVTDSPSKERDAYVLPARTPDDEDRPACLPLPAVARQLIGNHPPIEVQKKISRYSGIKRLTDICIAASLLVLFSPVLAALAVAIFLQDGGPVLFRQTRVGWGGREFVFYKFRSMVQNADTMKERLMMFNEASGPIFKMQNDPRVTPLGRILRRYSLDELPQLFNVLRGDMSLVGPRPHLPQEVARYSRRQQERLSVMPGLLCLREVSGRSRLSFDEWVELDLRYIREASPWLDCFILLRAVRAVLRGDGAH